MESDNPLLECFSKVEVDSTMDDETFVEICAAYEVLKGTGIMVLSPEKDVALRIRRFSRRGFSAAYMPRFRDVVIPVSESGHFVHEYGHALDFCYGNPSRSVEFLPVIAMYRTMVSEAASYSEYSYDTETECKVPSYLHSNVSVTVPYRVNPPSAELPVDATPKS